MFWVYSWWPGEVTAVHQILFKPIFNMTKHVFPKIHSLFLFLCRFKPARVSKTFRLRSGLFIHIIRFLPDNSCHISEMNLGNKWNGYEEGEGGRGRRGVGFTQKHWNAEPKGTRATLHCNILCFFSPLLWPHYTLISYMFVTWAQPLTLFSFPLW